MKTFQQEQKKEILNFQFHHFNCYATRALNLLLLGTFYLEVGKHRSMDLAEVESSELRGGFSTAFEGN